MLDEHHDRAVAAELRARGHDVVAVTERPELRQLSDAMVLAAAAAERRALVTENVRHFAVLHRDAVASGKPHYGVIFTSGRRFPRVAGRSADLVAALEELLDAQTDEAALRGETHWL